MSGDPSPYSADGCLSATGVQVFEFMLSVLDAPLEVRDAIHHSDADIDIQSGTLLFSLEGLHTFLSHHCENLAGIGMANFQRTLYSSNLNEALARHRLVVEIAENRGKVRLNRYRLKSLDKATADND